MTYDELQEIAQKELEAQKQYNNRFHVCMAASCAASQGDKVKQELAKAVTAEREARLQKVLEADAEVRDKW